MKRFIVIGMLAAAAAVFGVPTGQVRDARAATVLCKFTTCKPVPSTQCMATTLRTWCQRQYIWVAQPNGTLAIVWTGCKTKACLSGGIILP